MKRNKVESEKTECKLPSVSYTLKRKKKKKKTEILNLGYHSKCVVWNAFAKCARFTLFMCEEKNMYTFIPRKLVRSCN